MENLTGWTVVATTLFFIAVWLYSNIKRRRMNTAAFRDDLGTRKAKSSHEHLWKERFKQRKADQIKLVASICLSVLLTFSALYIILSQKYQDADTKWAYGIVGSMIGYWMKS